tara:strand:- start:193 stop:348 length:156 start_codon:yes stop_codon:yes gene_type:complete
MQLINLNNLGAEPVIGDLVMYVHAKDEAGNPTIYEIKRYYPQQEEVTGEQV